MSNQNVIELKQTTIETLKRISKVNQSIRLVKDSKELKSKSQTGVMFCIAPIEDTWPRDFNIYNVNEFLSVLDIVETPELDFSSDKYVTIRSKDGKQKLRYLESAPEYITSYTDKIPPMAGSDIEVTVTENQFKSIIKAAQTMNLEYVGFVGDGDKVSITAFNKNNGDNADTNTFSIELGDSSTDQTFKMYYKLKVHEIDILQGEGSLEFSISSRKISKVKTESSKTFYITMDPKSEFGV